MRRALLLVAVGVTVLALGVGAALATPPSKQTSTLITRATLGKFEEQNQGIEVESQRRSADVAIVSVVLGPEARLAGTIIPVLGWLRSSLVP
jgi:hypothetical protein